MTGLVVLVLVGCVGGKAPEDDSGGPTGGTTGVDGSCGPWTGFVDGRTWRYVYTAGGATEGEWSDVLGTIAADGTVTSHRSLAQTNGATAYAAETDTVYRCKADGLWLVSASSTWTSTFDGATSEGWQDSAWASSGPVAPRVLDVGTRWEWSYDLTYTASFGDGAQAGTVTYEVEASESVATVAGTWDALQVFETTDQGASLRSWYAQDVGLVATETVELVAIFE